MATENDLLSRIEGLEIRFQEITSLITAPDIIADQKRFMKLSKEYRDLERILDKGKEYRNLLGNIQEGRDTLEAESDPELRAMAREMMQEAEQRIPSLEEEIKLLLIPADPEDAKNVVMEIRGGTGGDEAALFAGDLYKMYVRYCEGRGWTTEVTSMSEGTAGGYKEIIFTVDFEIEVCAVKVGMGGINPVFPMDLMVINFHDFLILRADVFQTGIELIKREWAGAKQLGNHFFQGFGL